MFHSNQKKKIFPEKRRYHDLSLARNFSSLNVVGSSCSALDPPWLFLRHANCRWFFLLFLEQSSASIFFLLFSVIHHPQCLANNAGIMSSKIFSCDFLPILSKLDTRKCGFHIIMWLKILSFRVNNINISWKNIEKKLRDILGGFVAFRFAQAIAISESFPPWSNEGKVWGKLPMDSLLFGWKCQKIVNASQKGKKSFLDGSGISTQQKSNFKSSPKKIRKSGSHFSVCFHLYRPSIEPIPLGVIFPSPRGQYPPILACHLCLIRGHKSHPRFI